MAFNCSTCCIEGTRQRPQLSYNLVRQDVSSLSCHLGAPKDQRLSLRHSLGGNYPLEDPHM